MYKYPFLDFNKINEHMISLKLKSYEKLPYIFEKMEGDFLDENKRILKGSKVALVGIGGLPISIKDNNFYLLNKEFSLKEIKKELFKTLGFSASMSYMNPYNKDFIDLADKTLSLSHNSIKHSIMLNILLVGISSGVEHEFCCQRDIIHLSRLTVAKTKAQSKPCLVLEDPDYVDIYKEILLRTDNIIQNNKGEKDLEKINLLYPSAKASMIMISGTLRNIEKLIELKTSDGKEKEFIEALTKIESIIDWLK